MQIFGEAAEQYDVGRPGYAGQLVPEVLAYAGATTRSAVEVGAGTGKATVPFMAAGVAVTCVEPDPRMAAVLRRNAPAARIVVSTFDAWRPDAAYDLLYAATSWHWVAADRQWDLAHAALTSGGSVALFWNPQGVLDPAVHAALAEVDRRIGMADAPHAKPATAYGPAAGDWSGPVGWPAPSCRADGRFTDLRSRRFRQQTRYSTARYLDFLASVSSYRMLPAATLERALTETAAVLDEHGGGIDMLHLTDLFLARRN